MIIYITEKRSQGEALAKALGIGGSSGWAPEPFLADPLSADGDQRRVICWTNGSLFQLRQPEDLMPDLGEGWSWEKLPVSSDVLLETFDPFTDRDEICRRYEPRKDAGANMLANLDKLVEAIRDLEMNGHGKVQEVVIATDAGREGEYIGRLAAGYCGWTSNRSVKRTRLCAIAMVSEHLNKANDERRPAVEFDRLFDAAYARDVSGWSRLYSYSRAWTLFNDVSRKIEPAQGEEYTAISIRPEVTATLGRIVEWWDDPQPEQRLEMPVQIESPTKESQIELTLHAVSRCPFTEALQAAVEEDGWEGELCISSTLRTETLPPKPLDMAALQYEASLSPLSWRVQKTHDIAEELYLNGYITYPRTDGESYHPDEYEYCEAVVNQQGWNNCERARWRLEPVGRFDGGQQSWEHPAIRPEPLASSNAYPTEGETGKLMELILKNFKQQCAGSWKNDSQEFEAKVMCEDGSEIVFRADRRRTDQTQAGWSTIETSTACGRNSCFEDILDIPDGKYKATATKVTVHKIPKLTEGEVVKLLIKGNGLGTAANRTKYVEQLKEMGYAFNPPSTNMSGANTDPVTTSESDGLPILMPTERGRRLIELLKNHQPDLLDIRAVTGFNDLLKQIEIGQCTICECLNVVKNEVSCAVDSIRKLVVRYEKDQETGMETLIGPESRMEMWNVVPVKKLGRFVHYEVVGERVGPVSKDLQARHTIATVRWKNVDLEVVLIGPDAVMQEGREVIVLDSDGHESREIVGEYLQRLDDGNRMHRKG